MQELQIIESNLSRFTGVVVLIDDIRCFEPSSIKFSQYPDRSQIVDWANRNGLEWRIELDIFIAKSSPLWNGVEKPDGE